MSFSLPSAAGGSATLQHRTPVGLRAVQIIVIVLWLVAVVVVAVDVRRRRAEHPPIETVRPEWFAPAGPGGPRPGRFRSGERSLGADDLQAEEVWIDG